MHGNLSSMIFNHLYQWLGIAWLAGVVITALVRGGTTERVTAGVMAAAWLASGAVQNTQQMWGAQAGIMAIDLLLLGFLAVVALTSDRWWPMWATAFHGLGVLVHVAVILDEKIWGRAYFIAGAVFSYLTVLALLLGALGRRPPADTAAQASDGLTPRHR